jgi:hypothetical protein
LPAMKGQQNSTARKTPINSDLRTIDRSDKSSVGNIVGGNVLPFSLPLRFGAPTTRETEMRTRGTSGDYSMTPQVPGRFGVKKDVFSRTDRNFH